MPAITMPQLGESVTEGTIARWLKKPGDPVKRDESIVEIITDKVNAEIPAPVAGVLERISVPEGETVKVGQEIAFLATEADARAATPAVALAAVAATPAPASADGGAAEGNGEGPRSSPLVRKLAKEHGLDLRLIPGTGLGGRVTREDVERYLKEQPAATAGGMAGGLPQPSPLSIAPERGEAAVAAPPQQPQSDRGRGGEGAGPTVAAPADQQLSLSPMRRTIAQRMVQSEREIPHAWLMVEVDVTGLVRFREQTKEQFRRSEGVDLTYVPFVLKAAVEALREVPVVNASWQDNQIVLKREINLGVAVALDDGLVVPVIRGADQKNVTGLAHALADLVGRARSGKLGVADVEGGTFTVNNTGAFGSVASQPIINYPQAAIMNLETIVKRPVVVSGDTGDAIAIRSMVNLCLSFDHRILDGATAGRFLQAVKRRLENWGVHSSL
jgi:2-oxoisovalerate dehydrogenase E2 component (dihydrolipoyl transacylase)